MQITNGTETRLWYTFQGKDGKKVTVRFSAAFDHYVYDLPHSALVLLTKKEEQPTGKRKGRRTFVSELKKVHGIFPGCDKPVDIPLSLAGHPVFGGHVITNIGSALELAPGVIVCELQACTNEDEDYPLAVISCVGGKAVVDVLGHYTLALLRGTDGDVYVAMRPVGGASVEFGQLSYEGGKVIYRKIADNFPFEFEARNEGVLQVTADGRYAFVVQSSLAGDDTNYLWDMPALVCLLDLQTGEYHPVGPLIAGDSYHGLCWAEPRIYSSNMVRAHYAVGIGRYASEVVAYLYEGHGANGKPNVRVC